MYILTTLKIKGSVSLTSKKRILHQRWAKNPVQFRKPLGLIHLAPFVFIKNGFKQREQESIATLR